LYTRIAGAHASNSSGLTVDLLGKSQNRDPVEASVSENGCIQGSPETRNKVDAYPPFSLTRGTISFRRGAKETSNDYIVSVEW
jgi:hypothetical protein